MTETTKPPCPGCGKRRDICQACRKPARIIPDDNSTGSMAVHDDRTLDTHHDAHIHGGCFGKVTA